MPRWSLYENLKINGTMMKSANHPKRSSLRALNKILQQIDLWYNVITFSLRINTDNRSRVAQWRDKTFGLSVEFIKLWCNTMAMGKIMKTFEARICSIRPPKPQQSTNVCYRPHNKSLPSFLCYRFNLFLRKWPNIGNRKWELANKKTNEKGACRSVRFDEF